ncbi:LmbE-like protein [Aspergillus avenaceus]|uniref:N-acetylglucosaminylphosphatidylinositol deacetylase n=1 Tax=Aspergillus avenaceus TaxID=36643 RepID=A0A5N6U5P9_ASPAV|nr:LmbE-like protein [Aspergillus avenaceus]
MPRLLSKRYLQRTVRKSSTIVLPLLIIPFVLYHLLAYPLANDLVPGVFRTAKSILLVTAHPDDESLFFGPSTLYRADDQSVTRSLLVFSDGNYRGLGDLRRSELQRSCAELGITVERCVNVDHAELQDDPHKWWNEDLIEEIVAEYVKKWNVDLIFTFDPSGISGHINHRAINAGVSKYVSKNPQGPPGYALQTKSWLRKYAGWGDLVPTAVPFTGRIVRALVTPRPGDDGTVGGKNAKSGDDSYGDKALVVSNWRDYFRARRAFGHHGSQYSFDRRFYLIISRYMWYNDLRKML